MALEELAHFSVATYFPGPFPLFSPGYLSYLESDSFITTSYPFFHIFKHAQHK